jgi:ligand-binding sensor domain-containing protein/signal transduction histidine kinase/CheY-like chemotaxis protein
MTRSALGIPFGFVTRAAQILGLAMALVVPLTDTLTAQELTLPISTPPKHTTRIGLEEGLSQNTVTAILQAKNGLIWLATRDGVNIFDGADFTYLFRTLGTLTGLQSNFARSLFQDMSGAVWVGTTGGGLSKFDENGAHLATYNIASDTLLSDDVYAVTQTPDGAIWAGTANGVARLLPDETTFLRIYTLPRETARAILAMPDGSVLIGTQSNGLIHLAPEDRTFERFTSSNSALPSNSITSLYQDRDLRVWIGTQSLNDEGKNHGPDHPDSRHKNHGGLARYTPQTNTIDTPVALPDEDIEAIAEGFDGRMWFGSWSNGIFVWNTHTGAIENYRASPTAAHRLASNKILSLAPDQTGRMWVGSYDAGAASLSQFPDPFISFAADPTNEQGPRSGEIWALAEAADNSVWIGTQAGLYLLNRTTHHVAEIPLTGTAASEVRALLPDGDGLLISTRPQGLLRYDPQTKTTAPLVAPNAPLTPILDNKFVRLMMRDTRGDLWLGTDNGLYLLAPNNFQIAHFAGNGMRGDIPSPQIRAIYEAPDGQIWIGTSEGIARYLPSTQTFEILSGPSLLPDDHVRALLQISPDTLLAATGGGLSRIDLPSRTARFILRTEGLPSETLFSLIPDTQDDIWITTSNGLARYTPQTDAIKSFYARDGLPGNQFNYNAYARLRDGTLAVGGMDGLALFDPEHLTPNPIPPQTSLQLNSSTTSGLSTRSVDLTIGIRHYDDPRSNTLRWRLEPVDSEWLEFHGPTRRIVRESLPAGDYALHYFAISAGGAVGPEQHFRFTIPRSRFQSWYAYLAYAAALIGVIWLFANLRLAQISRRNHDLRNKIAEQTRALEDANTLLQSAAVERANFYARAAHEIRTPLSLITAPLQKILVSPALTPNERRLLQMVERASKRMVQMIDEMAAVTQEKTAIPSGQVTVDITQLLAPIIALYREAAAQNGQQLTVQHEGATTATFDAGAVETITHNLLSNAVRHAPRGSKITFLTRAEGAAITIQAANDGPPLSTVAVATLNTYATSAGHAPASRGLELIGAALNRVDGSLKISPSSPDIILTIPAYVANEDHTPISRAARILIVEDDTDLRDYLVTLTSAIAVPTAVGSLKAARRAVLRGSYELVICDVLLPDGSGFEFAQSLKTTPETSHITLVFLTALADAASYREGLNSWADDYLTKPFDAEDLLHKLRIRLRSHDRLRAHLKARIPLPAGDANSDPIVPLDQRFLAAFQAYLDANYANPDASLQDAAKHCAMSKRALQRKLETLFAKGFSTLLKEVRMEHASALLNARISVTETAQKCGYTTLSSFSRQFKDHFGTSPREFAKLPSEQK